MMRIYSFNDVDNNSVDRASIDDLILTNGEFGLVSTVNGQVRIVQLMPQIVGGSSGFDDDIGNRVLSITPSEVRANVPLVLSSDPQSSNQAATKQYVDNAIAAAIAAALNPQ